MDDERALIERLRARDESAFVELVERYYGYLLPLANFFVSNRAVAEEVVQQAWLGVLIGIDQFEERSSFKTWISPIVMNLARTRGVRESRMVPLSEFSDKEADHSEPAVDQERFRIANSCEMDGPTPIASPTLSAVSIVHVFPPPADHNLG